MKNYHAIRITWRAHKEIKELSQIEKMSMGETLEKIFYLCQNREVAVVDRILKYRAGKTGKVLHVNPGLAQKLKIESIRKEINLSEYVSLLINFYLLNATTLTKNVSKRLFFDLETTGVDWNRNAIHQLAAFVEIDGNVIEHINLNIRPWEGCKVDPVALEVGNVTIEDLRLYRPQEEQFKAFKEILSKYVDKFDKKDKFHLVGYNNRYFDDRFLRAWFEINKDNYFGSWFWADSLDVMVLASQHLIDDRPYMANFKLKTVAKTLGIEVESDRLHEGLYDVELTREIYNQITGLNLLA